MTKQEAKEALEQGKKVRHRFFTKDEYIVMKDGELMDEHGHFMGSDFWHHRTKEYWNIDWEIAE